MLRDFGLGREDEIEVLVDAVKLLKGEIKSNEYVEKAIASKPIKAFAYGILYHYALLKKVPGFYKVDDQIFDFLTAYSIPQVQQILEIITPKEAEQ